MEPQVVAAIVGGIAGFATGAVSSLVAPWSNWGVEKRRIRHLARIEMVKDWREGLNAAETTGQLDRLNGFQWYATLRNQRRPARLRALRRRAKRLIPKKWRKSSPGLLPTPARTVVISDVGTRIGTAIEVEKEINRIAGKWGID